MDTEELILIGNASIEFVVGIVLNLHILLIYIGNLQNGLSLGPSHKIHLTKALVNVSLQMMLMAQCITFAFWPFYFFTTQLFFWNTMINMFLNFYSFWLTAVLCFYYCTSITTCGHHIFVWLKRSLSSYLLHILLVSGLGSVAISVPVFWFCTIEPAGNSTLQSIILRGKFFTNITYKTTSSILGCFLPFSIALVSTGFTSWSLLHHMWRMKQNNPGFTRSKFQTQINATRTMILFLLISVIYSAIQMFFLATLSSTSNAMMIVIWAVVLSYPISEAAIITQSSSKLRNSILWKFFDRQGRNDKAET